MSETTSSPIIMALLFVLRCLIPLGILFGISYLLRRLELVIDNSDKAPEETKAEAEQTPAAVESASPVVVDSDVKDPPTKAASSKKKSPSGKKPSATSKKKKEQNQ